MSICPLFFVLLFSFYLFLPEGSSDVFVWRKFFWEIFVLLGSHGLFNCGKALLMQALLELKVGHVGHESFQEVISQISILSLVV